MFDFAFGSISFVFLFVSPRLFDSKIKLDKSLTRIVIGVCPFQRFLLTSGIESADVSFMSWHPTDKTCGSDSNFRHRLKSHLSCSGSTILSPSMFEVFHFSKFEVLWFLAPLGLMLISCSNNLSQSVSNVLRHSNICYQVYTKLFFQPKMSFNEIVIDFSIKFRFHESFFNVFWRSSSHAISMMNQLLMSFPFTCKYRLEAKFNGKHRDII